MRAVDMVGGITLAIGGCLLFFSLESYPSANRSENGELLLRIITGSVLAVTGLVILALVSPTAKMKQAADRLRPWKGKSKAEVLELMGEPKESRRNPDSGRLRLTWRTLLFSITAEFDEGECLGVVDARN